MVQSEGGGRNSIDNLSFNSGSRIGPGSLPVAVAGKRSRRKLSTQFTQMYKSNTVKTKQSIDSKSNRSSDGDENIHIPETKMKYYNSEGLNQLDRVPRISLQS